MRENHKTDDKILMQRGPAWGLPLTDAKKHSPPWDFGPSLSGRQGGGVAVPSAWRNIPSQQNKGDLLGGLCISKGLWFPSSLEMIVYVIKVFFTTHDL